MLKKHDYDKTLTRLTNILKRLYDGEKLSVKELSEEFGVSDRTIQRDFNERLISYPIEKEGRRWKMQEGHHLTKERSPQEELVLEMLGNIANSIGDDFGKSAKSLFDKLQNSHTSPLYSRTVIEDISDSIDIFRQLEEAIAGLRIVTFSYNKKLRHVKPLRIVSFQGYWYLFGEELLQSALKTFYFKSIGSLTVTNESFEMRDDAIRTLDRAINVWFQPDSEPFEVILKASPDIAKYFTRRPLSSTQKILNTYDDGTIEMSVTVTSDNEILHEVKQWMPELTILYPKELALKAKEMADNFLNQQINDLIER
ncbi:MAG: WYL domain-containing transcriptional regulator [Campylobacterota bacterium]|nr:WYL domain-containing transcriptional regulator [Campylobacterota bacterium]